MVRQLGGRGLGQDGQLGGAAVGQVKAGDEGRLQENVGHIVGHPPSGHHVAPALGLA